MTTPSKSPAHPWIDKDLKKLKAKGNIISFTIDDNALLTPEMIEEIITERYDSRENPDFRREYLLELIADTNLRVVPEFDKVAHVINDEYLESFSHDVPMYGYVSADLGVVDYTGIVGGMYIPSENTLVITHESMYNGETPAYFVGEWQDMKAVIDTQRRDDGKDVDTVLIVDSNSELTMLGFRRDYNMPVKRAYRGKSKVDNVAFTRMHVKKGRVLIHERCTQLIDQLCNGMWKETTSEDEKNRKFERTEVYGHLDLIDGLVYLIRGIPWGRVPGEAVSSSFALGVHRCR